MKISQQLYQFPDPSLLLVLDGRQARLLFVHTGLLTEWEKVRLDPTAPRGRRTLLARRGRQSTTFGGASKEEDALGLFRQLLGKVNDRAMRSIHDRGIAACYVFAPEHLLPVCLAAFHPYIKKLVRGSYAVDLVHAHPSVLVERISTERQ